MRLASMQCLLYEDCYTVLGWIFLGQQPAVVPPTHVAVAGVSPTAVHGYPTMNFTPPSTTSADAETAKGLIKGAPIQHSNIKGWCWTCFNSPSTAIYSLRVYCSRAPSNMKSIAILSALAGLSTALPITGPAASDPVLLDIRQLGSNTRNDLTNGSPCKAVTVIFARGTGESGNVGSIARPPFFTALGSTLGSSNVAVQGIDYSASVAGFLSGGDTTGSSTAASLVNQVGFCLDGMLVAKGPFSGCDSVPEHKDCAIGIQPGWASGA